jgi:ribonucleotide monophosphatase NagD (HAD superfamily)
MKQEAIKVIFLDIDGVICLGEDLINPQKIELLNDLVKTTNAVIVISYLVDSSLILQN